MINIIFRTINAVVLAIPHLFLKVLKRQVFVVDAGGIGDSLALTAITDFLYQKDNKKSYVVTPFPELFLYNPSVAGTVKKSNISLKVIYRAILFFTKFSPFDTIILFGYVDKDKTSYLEETKKGAKMHLREFNLKHTPLFEKIYGKKLATKIYFSKSENKTFEENNRKYPKKYGVIMSDAKTKFSVIKNWGYKNFQYVVNNTDIAWVQLGIPKDKKLENSIDMRRLSLRESLYTISKSKVVVCSEGFFTHASGAFGMPCITVTSGFVPPEMTMYENITHVEREPKLDCRYCGATTKCPLYAKPICITEIKPQDVIKRLPKFS